jgi:hypothetical protein
MPAPARCGELRSLIQDRLPTPTRMAGPEPNSPASGSRSFTGVTSLLTVYPAPERRLLRATSIGNVKATSAGRRLRALAY